MIYGITRVRNEELIIEDTLRHYLKWCDRILVYDDDSTDRTTEIAKSFKGISVLHGSPWSLNRPLEETRHRALLFNTVKGMGAEWVLCFDADERLVGKLPDMKADGYAVPLFDAYMTNYSKIPYQGGILENTPRMWGPECRPILMLFKATDNFLYRGLDQRAPCVTPGTKVEITQKLFCKHFGKAISIEQWEDTCEYYAAHFPEPYRTKWNARRGKALHVLSDYNRRLYGWDHLISRRDVWCGE